jgi:hypothetical protein
MDRTLLTRLAFLWLTRLWYHFFSYPVFMPKLSIDCMYDLGSIVLHIQTKSVHR